MSSSLARRLISGSITAARLSERSHLHRMDGYTLIEHATKPGSAVSSSTFVVGGRKWELLLYPNGIDADHRGFVSADLRIAYGDDKYGEAATASYRVSILDYAGNLAHSAVVGPCRFGRGLDRGDELVMKKKSVDELVAVEELRRSAPSLLRNDRLNVLCDVSVIEMERAWRNKWFMPLWNSTAPSKDSVIS